MLVAVFTTMILSQSVGLCLPKRRRAGAGPMICSLSHDSNGAKMDVTDLKIEIPPRKETEKQPETDLRSLKDEKNPLLDPNVRDRLMSKRNAEKTKETAQAQHPADSPAIKELGCAKEEEVWSRLQQTTAMSTGEDVSFSQEVVGLKAGSLSMAFELYASNSNKQESPDSGGKSGTVAPGKAVLQEPCRLSKRKELGWRSALTSLHRKRPLKT
ncbi:hypothetical protein NECAME_17630 [Necator americanus]|uniref:Uncharacterized protein n=1 Tax=Necator americanus TaxID=51031 RepID=W2TL62_NECAM|nr:hypothetical protein NECAME_17630 [Necator americanus]ETN82825.1 hypothetical protein NECAME_17630 [Necator americanus]